MRAAIGIAGLVRIGATQRIVDSRLRESRRVRVPQFVQRRREEARAPRGTQQQRLHRLPTEAQLRVGGAAEVAVVIVSNRDVAFEDLHDRDVQLAEHGILCARVVDDREVAAVTDQIARLQRRARVLGQLRLGGLNTQRKRQRPRRQLVDIAGTLEVDAVSLQLGVERVLGILQRMNLVGDRLRIRAEQIHHATAQQRNDLRVQIEAADRPLVARVLAVVERSVPVPILPRALKSGDDLPCLVGVLVVPIAALDAAVAHAEWLAVDAVGGGERVRVERRVRLQDDFRVAAGRRRRGDLVRERRRLDDEPRLLPRVQPGHVGLPVGIDLIARSAEEIQLFRVRYGLDTGDHRRVVTAAAPEGNMVRTAVRIVRIANTGTRCRIVDEARKCLPRRRADGRRPRRNKARFREVAILLVQRLLLRIVDGEEGVPLILAEVAPAHRSEYLILIATAAARRRAIKGGRVDSGEVLAHDEIDDAADRIAAVDGGRSAIL